MARYSMRLVAVIVLGWLLCWASSANDIADQERLATQFLKEYEKEAKILCLDIQEKSWTLATNFTDENQKALVPVDEKMFEFDRKKWCEAKKFNLWNSFKNDELRRQMRHLAILGVGALDIQDYHTLGTLISEMEENYAKHQICSYKNKANCNLKLEPDLMHIMSTSRDPEELKHTWLQWHEVGLKIKGFYPEYVDLYDKAAKLNNFNTSVEMWLSDYETPHIKKDLENLWLQVKPLYQHLHAYVRSKLADHYGEKIVSRTGPIPAHLLGNMWANDWTAIWDITVPFRKCDPIDVTGEMLRQNYTVERMFKEAEKFFVGLGFRKLPKSFWTKSMFVRPDDGRDVVCHASAWDFCGTDDVRIKMCTTVNMERLIAVHHELGHIYYFLSYMDKPFLFQDGANPGFHESIGDTIALSVFTAEHMKKLKLVDKNKVFDYEAEINYMYSVALHKLAFLPYGYLLDVWRWEVLEKKIPPEKYNSRWWELRKEIQGIIPPEPRGENYFDPGGIYHVASDTAYIRYFVSHILEFEFHKSLCTAAGQYYPKNPSKRPLHKCDIGGCKAAGKVLKDILSLGSSKHWKQILKSFTGQENMDASPIIEYFKPLMDFLKDYNKGKEVGW